MKQSDRLKFLKCLLALLFAVIYLPAYAENSKVRVFTSILPQKYFVEKIAGDLVEVEVLVGSGMSPHTFEPLPQQMSRLSRAAVFFMIGVPFEHALVQRLAAVCPDLKFVDTGKNVARRSMNEQESDHQHSEDCVHEAGAPDPHIWLAPLLIKIQAATITGALCARDPANAGAYRNNLQAFQSELDMLDAEIREKVRPFAGREIFVFHPAFGYYTDAYGLRQIAIETEGKEPGSRSLAAVVDRAKNRRVKAVFAERQFSPKTATAVARQIGAEVITLDPLERDCFQNLRFMTDRIIYALSK